MLYFSSCREDEIISETTIEMLDETMFEGNVTGTVVDMAGNPIEDALISLSGQTEMSNDNGFFVFQDVSLSNFGEYIAADKSGYFHGGKNVFAISEGNYQVKITLIEYETQTSFSTSDGISFEASGATVEIPANSISLAGNVYDGTVQLYTRWLDPTQDETYSIMPGNLTAIDDDGQFQALLSFGMIGVDMFTPNGERLQLSESASARLTFPIPNSIQGDAAQTIDLWHFDENEGKWMQEGEAQRVGNHYEASVSHFSWWNCDKAEETTILCVNFVDRLNNPVIVQNFELVLSSINFGTASAIINSASSYCNIIPRGEPLLLQLLSPCGDIIIEQNIGPFENPEEDITIQIVDEFPFEILNFSGTLFNCDGEPVSNGFIELSSEETTSFMLTNTDGTYSINIFECGNASTVTVSGIDILNLAEGSETINIEDDVNAYVVNLDACDEVETSPSFFQFFSNTSGQFTSDICDARVTSAETLIISEEFILGISGFGEGNFKGNLLSTFIQTNELDLTDVEITFFGEVGENITGTFVHPEGSGTFIALRIQ